MSLVQTRQNCRRLLPSAHPDVIAAATDPRLATYPADPADVSVTAGQTFIVYPEGYQLNLTGDELVGATEQRFVAIIDGTQASGGDLMRYYGIAGGASQIYPAIQGALFTAQPAIPWPGDFAAPITGPRWLGV